MPIRASSAALAVVGAVLAATPALGQERLYKIIGVGDIMMGSDYPTPIMDARVSIVAAIRRR